MKYSNVIRNCMRSGILLLTLQLAGNSIAACDSTESVCNPDPASSSEQLISPSMHEQLDAMRRLYTEFGEEIEWLLEAKLGSGTAEERYAVLQVFTEHRVLGLIDQVIYSTTDISKVRVAPGKSIRVSDYAEEALITIAVRVGLWKDDYRDLYRNGSLENWKALFWDFQRNFVISATAQSSR